VEPVFRALADESRRELLDRLFERDGQSLAALCEGLEMTRFGVMKHLDVLVAAGLVTTRKVGREKLHYLNPVPIRLIHDRWISKFAEPWVGAMANLKHHLEETMEQPPAHIYEVYIRASAQAVWNAIIDPEQTKKYFHGTAFTSSLEPGTPWTCVAADGSTVLQGQVVEADPGRRLVLTFAMLVNPETAADRPSRVTWDIESMGETTKLTLTHDDFNAVTPTYTSVRFGWNPILSGLKTLLETGEPLVLGVPA
jgi:uncharacterized protein YndB with AHSA1/START domain/DNA-binding transcriptional ArsR family regulator